MDQFGAHVARATGYKDTYIDTRYCRVQAHFTHMALMGVGKDFRGGSYGHEGGSLTHLGCAQGARLAEGQTKRERSNDR